LFRRYSSVTLRVNTLYNVNQLGDFALAPLDEAECRALGVSGRDAIAQSIAGSNASYVLSAPEGPVFCWGCRTPVLEPSSIDIWLFTFRAIAKHKLEFVREVRRVHAILLDNYAKVRFNVWKEHHKALGLLARYRGGVYQSVMHPSFYTVEVCRGNA
jgi:hypothetical protein